jgi:hypothetical protein
MQTSSPSPGQTQLTLAGKGLAQGDHTGFQRKAPEGTAGLMVLYPAATSCGASVDEAR